MRRTPLYSRSPHRVATPATGPAAPVAQRAAPHDDPAQRRSLRTRAGGLLRRRERWAWVLGALLLAGAAGWPAWTAKLQRPLAIEQIDAALRESIAKEPLPSAAAAAYDAVIPSVVRVVGHRDTPPAAQPASPGRDARGKADAAGRGPGRDPSHDDAGRSVGSGVVIVDSGLILTSLHVVAGASRITLTFSDGAESEARLVNVQPENDLAVLQALTLPDDLQAATLRSTTHLAPGDEVVAVGFPFGIGPSASQGVVSGLGREFRSPEGQRMLSHLIQFDAAANPGNSGGPLVTMDGQVVGIVAAIMNPNEQRTFIGIAFAVPIENAAAAVGMPPF